MSEDIIKSKIREVNSGGLSIKLELITDLAKDEAHMRLSCNISKKLTASKENATILNNAMEELIQRHPTLDDIL